MPDHPTPELRALIVADDPAGWEAAGFHVVDNATAVGAIEVRFVGRSHDDRAEGSPDGGVVGVECTGVTDQMVDGLPVISTDRAPIAPGVHPNGVSRMDHVVIMTPDLDRTTSALEAAGFLVRRTRDVPGSAPHRRQAFLWAGDTILEVVGPVEPSGTDPASIWGLALTTEDLAGAVALLTGRVTGPKPAVQPGREIATIKTREFDISLALALMTPHVKADVPQANPGPVPNSSDA